MDPNTWSNYNQVYRRLGPGNSLPASHAVVNRFDLPLLAAEQAGLSTGLGLNPAIQPCTTLTSSKPLAGIPAYGHLNSMSQFLDTMGSLQSPFSAVSASQHPYKSVHVGQQVFGFQPAGQSAGEQHPIYGLTRQDSTGGTSQPKSSFYPHEANVSKELNLTCSPSCLSSQTSPLDTSPKGWGLSNFVPMQSSPFGNIPTDLTSHSQQVPPPAHSSTSHHDSIHRNPYQATQPFLNSKQENQPQMSQPISSLQGLGTGLETHVHAHSLPSVPLQLPLYASPTQLIEDLSLPQTKYSSDVRHGFADAASAAYSNVTPATSRYTSSHITTDMDYDPVSPATPLSETQQQPESFNTMSLQDLATIDSPDRNSVSHLGAISTDSSLLMSEPHNKVSDIGNQQQDAMNSTLHCITVPMTTPIMSQSNPSPLGQSPISVGGSPQAPVSVGSPSAPVPNPSVVRLASHAHINAVGSPQSNLQLSLPSSSIIHHQPPIQAVADSTTRPKKRGRKKKESMNIEAKEQIDAARIYQDRLAPQVTPDQAYNQSSLQSLNESMISDVSRQRSYLSQESHLPTDPRSLNLSYSTADTYLHQSSLQEQLQNTSESYSSISPPIDPAPPKAGPYSRMAQHNSSSHRLATMQLSIGNDGDDVMKCHQFSLNTLQDRECLSENVREAHSIITNSLKKTQTLPLSKEFDEPDFVDKLRASSLDSLENFAIQRHQASGIDVSTIVSEVGSIMQSKYHSQIHRTSIGPVHAQGTAVDILQNPRQFSAVGQFLNSDVSKQIDTEQTSPDNEMLKLEHNTSLVEALQATRHELESPSIRQPSLQTRADLLLHTEPQIDQFSETSAGSVTEDNQYNLARNNNSSFYNAIPLSLTEHHEMRDNFPGNYQNVIDTPSPGFRTDLGEFCRNSTSTIDESMLSSLMTNRSTSFGQERYHYRTKAEQKMLPYLMKTVTSKMEFDDDFAHLSRSPKVTAGKNEKKLEVTPADNKGKPADMKIRSMSSDFQNSFLNFLSGKKQETLSSLTNSVVGKKPQLPKYIPEPPRHLSDNSQSACSTPKPEIDSKSEGSINTRQNSPSDSMSEHTVAFSEEEDNSQNLSKSVQKAILSLDEDNQKCLNRPSLKLCISKQVLIANKPYKIKTTSSGTRALPRGRKGLERRRTSSYRESGDDQSSPEYVDEQPDVISEVVSQRHSSARKAKEKILKRKRSNKSYLSDETSEEDEWVASKKSGLSGAESAEYDSDDDPAWTPFSGESNKRVPYGANVPGKQYGRRKSKKKGGRSIRIPSKEVIPENISLMEEDPKKTLPVALSEKEAGNVVRWSPLPQSEPSADKGGESTDYQIGSFILDKKDLNNFESYPVWKIETNRMLQKFELFLDDGKIRHRALSTFSSWLPSLQNQFIPIRVNMVNWSREKTIIEVVEECRPKPSLDSSIAEHYEEDPLSDLFNVYLQVFLSQALEPGFLNAIRESNDSFYLSPLQKIDMMIDKKLRELEDIVCWKHEFKQCLKERPHLRELDRPNVKQACQASKFASHPAVKSIHLYGHPYDRFDLEEMLGSASVAKEFMIGKAAAQYVKPFHSLYHFKYNLYKRCLAKVNIIRDTEGSIENADILDQCLHNRTWVLKIFEDLKNMLDKG